MDNSPTTTSPSSENAPSDTPTTSPVFIYNSQSLKIPDNLTNRELLKFIQKIDGLARQKRHKTWLLGTTGLPTIEFNRGLAQHKYFMAVRSFLAAVQSSP